MANLPPPPLQIWRDLPKPWAQWFTILWRRVGGSESASIDELNNTINQMPPIDIHYQEADDDGNFEVSALRAEVDALRMEIEAIKQGLNP